MIKYEYKLTQTVNGKEKKKEGVMMSTSARGAFLSIQEKIKEDATGFKVEAWKI